MDDLRYEAYADVAASIDDRQLDGFFEGWPTRPSLAAFRQILAGSHGAWVARAPDGEVVGFVTVVSDGVLSACLTLLEVRPAHRGRGVGSALVASRWTPTRGCTWSTWSATTTSCPSTRGSVWARCARCPRGAPRRWAEGRPSPRVLDRPPAVVLPFPGYGADEADHGGSRRALTRRRP